MSESQAGHSPPAADCVTQPSSLGEVVRTKAGLEEWLNERRRTVGVLNLLLKKWGFAGDNKKHAVAAKLTAKDDSLALSTLLRADLLRLLQFAARARVVVLSAQRQKDEGRVP